MKDFFKENILLFILLILCLFWLFIYAGHYSGILIDFGREVYYPQEILNGKVLYKDLFNIYGPLSYQINAILYKLFGAKLSTLYGAGICTSLLTISGIYLIGQKFLSKTLSCIIGFFTFSVGILTTSIFNFHFPYSWAVIYGLIAFLFSLYFLLNYTENKDGKNLYISSFLAGFAITCKYDFLLFALIVLFFIIKSKNWKALLCFCFMPLLSFGTLFLQGLRLNDLINSLLITSQMAKSKTLTYFYQNSGIYFNPKAILTDFILLLKFAIPVCAMFYGKYLADKKRVPAIILSVIGCLFFVFTFNVKYSLGFLPILLLVFLGIEIFNITVKKTKFDLKLIILLTSALAVCAKVFWVLLLGSYGNYYVSVALIAFFAFIFKYFPKNFESVAGNLVILMSLLCIFTNVSTINFTNNKISTQKGTIYTQKSYATSTNKLIEYLKTQTNMDDKVVIFPEGMTVNFLADRKSDDFYNSLLPLYIETFGEERIIEHYKKEMPEYIILNNLDMKDYYFRYICQDYALRFCEFVNNNYNLENIIDNEFRYLIFKRK